MNQVIFNLEALHHNLRTINRWVLEHGASWTVVSKVLCGHSDILRALHALGARAFGDSRLLNLESIRRTIPASETWYLRPPHLSAVKRLVTVADTSLNSEFATICALDSEARNLNTIHNVVIMIELGDLREGILPGNLVTFYESVFILPNIRILGLGANLGCLAGAIPNVDQLNQLELYRELLELKFNRTIPMLSAGSSAVLPLLRKGLLPKAVNHFRIGESLFLGTDLIDGGILDGLRDDVVIVEGEITEIKEKNLTSPCATMDMTPFVSVGNNDPQPPGKRGYRALIALGQLDTDVAGLTPVDSNHKIAGASSDITVVNLGDESTGLEVGDVIRFSVSYSALLRLMNDKYVPKKLISGNEPSVKPTIPRRSKIAPTNLTICREDV